MVKFETLFINFALTGLLVVSILAFGFGFQSDNNASETIFNNTLVNDSFSQLMNDLGGMRDQSQTQKELFETEKPTAGFGSLILFSIVSSGKVFTGITIGLFNIFIKLPMVLFGVNQVVASVLSTIMIVVVILGIWVVIKLGG